jgi:hypothetical protein
MNIKRAVTILFIVIVIVGLAILANGCTRINEWMGWRQDNPAEEILEGIIEKETGVDVDLSWESPESV